MSDMRYFDNPEPFIAMNLFTKKPLTKPDPDWKAPKNDDKARAPEIQDDPWTIERYLIAWVLARPSWQKGVKMQRLTNRILAAVEDAKPGERIGIPAEAWRELKKTFDDEEFEVAWPLAPQLAFFADIIIDATDKAVVETPEVQTGE